MSGSWALIAASVSGSARKLMSSSPSALSIRSSRPPVLPASHASNDAIEFASDPVGIKSAVDTVQRDRVDHMELRPDELIRPIDG